ncbi:MAG: outer membrane lipoprotein LolB [Rhodocyclaceae bacterium]|nr:outer membrane lipoprotein LolB [Rhodocyclaceae bacterium]
MKRLAVLAAFLAACAQAPLVSHSSPSAERFALSARALVSEGNTRHYVILEWRRKDGRDDISLATPFGQRLAHLEGNGEARMTLANGVRREAESLDLLLAEILEFPLPLAEARDALFDSAVRERAGWRIRREPAEAMLPRRLELERAGLSIQLVIDSWESPE